MSKIYLNILDKKRLEVLKRLGFTRELKMYLAGGTALALQIGHRTSVDFDFYIPKNFKKGELKLHFKNNFKNYKIKILRDFDDTFEININGISLSCFYYPYKLIKKKVLVEGIEIADIEDITAMKLVAVSQRGTKRDFVDVYYLIKKFGLPKILKLTDKKYPEFDVYCGLRGLMYFDDADNDKEIGRIKIFDKKLKWVDVKKYIKQEIFNFQKNINKIKK